METHGFDPALCNNHLNPACSPVWLNAIVGAEWQGCMDGGSGLLLSLRWQSAVGELASAACAAWQGRPT